MGMTFENLTWDDLCDLMCGCPEEDYEEDHDINFNICDDNGEYPSQCQAEDPKENNQVDESQH